MLKNIITSVITSAITTFVCIFIGFFFIKKYFIEEKLPFNGNYEMLENKLKSIAKNFNFEGQEKFSEFFKNK